MQVICFSINFVIFIAALVVLLKKPILKYLKERKESFVNSNIEAQKSYDDAFVALNKVKDDIRNIEQKGQNHIEEVSAWAKSEAQTIVLGAESYSNTMLIGSEEMIKEETERAKNKEISKFIHSVIANTKHDVKNESSQSDYSSIYIKDYFTETKRLNV